MVMMVVEENKSNACGLQNIVMDWRKLATLITLINFSTIVFETGIQHKEMLFT